MDSRFFERVAMYLRKSRAEEGEETEVVLAKHRAQLSRYAAEHMINVVKIYEEVVSGDSLFSRPQMLQLLNDIENQEYTGVLCMDIDRLGRGNMKEQGLILETFKNSSTAIITPDKIYDLNNELDETQSEFKTFMARQELKMIKKRLSRGLHLTIEKGGYVSNIPFGYKRGYKNKVPTLAPHCHGGTGDGRQRAGAHTGKCAGHDHARDEEDERRPLAQLFGEDEANAGTGDDGQRRDRQSGWHAKPR